MLFDVENISGAHCADAIRRAIVAQDAGAEVTVALAEKRVRVEGRISEQQALAAMARAGYRASNAGPHSGAGSDCCGGCS